MAKGNRGREGAPVAPGGASPYQQRESDLGQDLSGVMQRLKSLSPSPAGEMQGSAMVGQPVDRMGQIRQAEEEGAKQQIMPKDWEQRYQASQDAFARDRAAQGQAQMHSLYGGARQQMQTEQNSMNDRLKELTDSLNKTRTGSGVGGYVPGTPPAQSISPLPAVAQEAPLPAASGERSIKGWTPFGAGVNASKDQAAQYITQQLQQRGVTPDQNLWNELGGQIGWNPNQASVTGEQGNKMMRFLADKYKWEA